MNKPGKQEWSSQQTWKRNSEERGEYCLVREGDGVVLEKMDTWTLQKCDEEEGSDGWTWKGKEKEEEKVEFVMREERMKQTLLLLLLLLIRILISLGFLDFLQLQRKKKSIFCSLFLLHSFISLAFSIFQFSLSFSCLRFFSFCLFQSLLRVLQYDGSVFSKN